MYLAGMGPHGWRALVFGKVESGKRSESGRIDCGHATRVQSWFAFVEGLDDGRPVADKVEERSWTEQATRCSRPRLFSGGVVDA